MSSRGCGYLCTTSRHLDGPHMAQLAALVGAMRHALECDAVIFTLSTDVIKCMIGSLVEKYLVNTGSSGILPLWLLAVCCVGFAIVQMLYGKKQSLDKRALWLCVRWYPMHCNGKQLMLCMGFLLIISSFSVLRPPTGIVPVILVSASVRLSSSWKTNSSLGCRLRMATFRVCVS